MKKSGKLYTLVACSRVHGVGEKELSPSPLVRVMGEGRAPSPVPQGKTHLVEGEKCSPSVCAPVWSGNFTGLSPVPPQLYKSVLTAPFPPPAWGHCLRNVLCSVAVSMFCTMLLLVGVSEHILKL